MPGIFWFALVAIGLGLAIWYQWKFHWYPLQYIYFLRAPLTSGFALVFLWCLGSQISFSPFEVKPAAFHNMFLLRDGGLALVVGLAIVTAWVIVDLCRWLYAWTPLKQVLTLRGIRDRPETEVTADLIGSDREFKRIANTTKEDKYGFRHMLYSLLAAPLVFYVTALSKTPGYALLGAGSAFGLYYLARTPGWIRKARPAPDGDQIPEWLGKYELGDFDVEENPPALFSVESLTTKSSDTDDAARRALSVRSLEMTRWNLTLYFVGILVLYILGRFLLDPRNESGANIPMLGYVLMLLILITCVFSFLSFLLNKYRIPAEVVFVLWVTLMYGVFNVDYHYAVSAPPKDTDMSPLSPARYFTEWKGRPIGQEPERRKMIVVAASGGGLKAAYWTATVLTELERANDAFAESIVILSSTSGGGLGVMFYVDQTYEKAGLITEEGDREAVRNDILADAGHSSLSELGWGLLYGTATRMVLPPLAKGNDRGQALEARWSREFAGTPPLLSRWRDHSRDGWRPVVIFNATLVETGERYIISQLDSHAGSGWSEAKSFSSLYPGKDIQIVTAARLSASFAIASPVASPKPAEDPDVAYHVADGGYYDNYGVMSVIEFLRATRSETEEMEILLIEIRASPPPDDKAEGDLGFWGQLLAPLTTIEHVRGSSQIDRNDLELAILRDSWQAKRKADEEADASTEKRTTPVLDQALFVLGTESPLSWKLSQQEKGDIKTFWENDSDIRDNSAKVKEFLAR